MARIKVLDTLTANKIAAGEIIERPYSIVKELLENSLDAGADFIQIYIEDGGLGLIKITDNGKGIEEEDVLLAFERHATSKINNAQDLFNISTFGFRGEALPSIAAVSRVDLITKTSEAPIGTKVTIIGGKNEEKKQVAFTVGTTIEVRNLFFNTPARRKFIKSPSYEAGLITELITKYSLGHPNVRFKLKNKKEDLFDTAGLNTIQERLNKIYGENDNFVYIPKKEVFKDYFIEAWLSVPRFNRNTRSQQTFFLNGRLIKNAEMSRILDSSYKTLLSKGRFPVATVHLRAPFHELDVNIHPAKLEAKINNIENIKNSIIELLSNNLWNNNIVDHKTKLIDYPAVDSKISHNKKETDMFFKEEDMQYSQNEFYLEAIKAETFKPKNELKPIAEKPQQQRIINYEEPKEKVESKKVSIKNVLNLNLIGQLKNSFILAENTEGLYILDQHTCHERILYEKFLLEEKTKKIIAENLLIPISLTISGHEEAILLKHILDFSSCGFILENFGPRTYLLRSIPIGIEINNIKDFFQDLLTELAETQYLNSIVVKEKIITRASCKGAIKANQKLNQEEMLYLLQELSKVDNSHSCPHGRPIIHKITMKDLYKVFQRGEYKCD